MPRLPICGAAADGRRLRPLPLQCFAQQRGDDGVLAALVARSLLGKLGAAAVQFEAVLAVLVEGVASSHDDPGGDHGLPASLSSRMALSSRSMCPMASRCSRMRSRRAAGSTGSLLVNTVSLSWVSPCSAR